MSAQEHIDELLSGFLDGKLSADELRELNLAMDRDSGLNVKLERLRELGSDLRSIPKRTLGPNFADRVLAAARQEAQFQEAQFAGSGAPTYIDADIVRETVSAEPVIADSVRPASWFAWGPLSSVAIAIAATLFFAIYVGDWSGVSGDRVVQNVPNVPNAPLSGSSADASSPADAAASGGSANDSVASAEAREALPADGDADAAKSEAFVRSDRGLKPRLSGALSPNILFVLEIQPNSQAWKEDTLGKLLAEAGIEWSNPLRASAEIVEVLNQTRSISQGLPNASDDQVALVLVKAPAQLVDKISTKIWSRMESFPSVFFDMAFDLPGSDLVQKLTSAQEVTISTARPVATPIVTADRIGEGLTSLTDFSSPPRASYAGKLQRSQPIALSDMSGESIGLEDESEPSFLLLVVRKPLP